MSDTLETGLREDEKTRLSVPLIKGVEIPGTAVWPSGNEKNGIKLYPHSNIYLNSKESIPSVFR